MLSTSLAKQADIEFQSNLYEDPNPTRRGLHRARREWVEATIAKRLLPRGKVLEVGIGCGIFTRFLSRIGAQVTAVDINPAFVLGVHDLPHVTPVLADATTDIDLGQHDLALCSEVIEHVPPVQSLAMLKTLHRSLSPDGRLILTTPQRFATVELMARLLKFPPVLALARKLYGTADELGHINLLTARALRKQLKQAGFEIEEHCRFGFYLPVVAEFGGNVGARALTLVERALARIPLLRSFIWTQAYVLKKTPQPTQISNRRAAQSKVVTRAVGFAALPISLIVVAAWLAAGTLFVGGSLLVRLIGKLFEISLGAADHAGEVLLGR